MKEHLASDAHLYLGVQGGLSEEAAHELRCVRWVGLS